MSLEPPPPVETTFEAGARLRVRWARGDRWMQYEVLGDRELCGEVQHLLREEALDAEDADWYALAEAHAYARLP